MQADAEEAVAERTGRRGGRVRRIAGRDGPAHRVRAGDGRQPPVLAVDVQPRGRRRRRAGRLQLQGRDARHDPRRTGTRPTTSSTARRRAACPRSTARRANAEGRGGIQTVREATTGSVNCAFVSMSTSVGLDKVAEMATKLGMRPNVDGRQPYDEWSRVLTLTLGVISVDAGRDGDDRVDDRCRRRASRPGLRVEGRGRRGPRDLRREQPARRAGARTRRRRVRRRRAARPARPGRHRDRPHAPRPGRVREDGHQRREGHVGVHRRDAGARRVRVARRRREPEQPAEWRRGRVRWRAPGAHLERVHERGPGEHRRVDVRCARPEVRRARPVHRARGWPHRTARAAAAAAPRPDDVDAPFPGGILPAHHRPAAPAPADLRAADQPAPSRTRPNIPDIGR